MPYLGKQAEEGGALIRTHEFLQGTDTASSTTAFTVASSGGDYVRVFLNGVLLQEGASNDYTKTTSAVTIVGTAPADGDLLKVDIYESITIWDTVPATGGTFSGDVTFASTQTPIPLSFTTKTATATLTTSEKGVIIANKASAFTINLPAVSGNSGLFYHIKSIGAGVVTVDGNSSETIDGQTTQVLTQWNNMYIITNGTTWYIL